jgi:hypothetical protein
MVKALTRITDLHRRDRGLGELDTVIGTNLKLVPHELNLGPSSKPRTIPTKHPHAHYIDDSIIDTLYKNKYS